MIPLAPEEKSTVTIVVDTPDKGRVVISGVTGAPSWTVDYAEEDPDPDSWSTGAMLVAYPTTAKIEGLHLKIDQLEKKGDGTVFTYRVVPSTVDEVLEEALFRAIYPDVSKHTGPMKHERETVRRVLGVLLVLRGQC